MSEMRLSESRRAGRDVRAVDAAAPPDLRTTDLPTADGREAAGEQSEAESERAAQLARAVSFVLKSTRQRPQTAAEIADKLTARDVDEDVRAEAIARAERIGAIDDAAFARAWVRDRGERRGYGAPRLAEELARRRVPDHIAEEALAELADRDELAVATELARGRLDRLPAALPPETVARRLISFLVRRGYAPGLARRVAVTVSGLDREWD